MSLLACALASLATSLPAAPAHPTPEPVIAAERAFAALAQEKGIAAAFHSYAAEEGIVFSPGPVRAKPLFEKKPAHPEPSLVWWPVFAGMAASGDLGFTTGPFRLSSAQGTQHGHFFTIWRRQPDGTWRWVLDHGPPTREASPLGPDTAVALLAPAAPAGGRVEAGWESVAAAETALAAALAADARAALASALLDEARLLRAGPQPAIGRAAFAEALAAGPARIDAHHIGGGISAAGDLAYSYGHAAWETKGEPRRGHYVRVWQHGPQGWRLAVDALVPALPPPPPPPPKAAP